MPRMKKTTTVGQRIHTARHTYGINQRELADNLGITRAAVSQYEQDRIRPRAKVIAALAEYFLSDPAWFEHGLGRPPSAVNAPVTISEVNAERLTSIADPRNIGRRWTVPASALTPPAADDVGYAPDHLLMIVAPNDCGAVSAGDSVVIVEAKFAKHDGIALVLTQEGPQLLADGSSVTGQDVAGYAIAYFHAL